MNCGLTRKRFFLARNYVSARKLLPAVLQFPEVSALDHILQTRVAKYGNEDPEGGSLTVLRREPLMNRLAKYTMLTKRKE